eukprot:1253124-Rhodomonas_salina.1
MDVFVFEGMLGVASRRGRSNDGAAYVDAEWDEEESCGISAVPRYQSQDIGPTIEVPDIRKRMAHVSIRLRKAGTDTAVSNAEFRAAFAAAGAS